MKNIRKLFAKVLYYKSYINFASYLQNLVSKVRDHLTADARSHYTEYCTARKCRTVKDVTYRDSLLYITLFKIDLREVSLLH
jgi:hypothetical protein